MKTALTIAGSDPSGGAGIQADLKVFSVLGVYGMSALTAVTVQNTTGVKEVLELEPAFVRKQIDAVAGDIEVDACKTGMLGNAAVIEAVRDAIDRNKLQPYVCDPVMTAKSGDELLKPEAVDALRRKLMPAAAVVTPNLREAVILANLDALRPLKPDDLRRAMNPAAGRDAARRLVGLGAKAVVIKGLEVGDQTVDLFYDGREFTEFAAKTMPREKTHGSGCAFSAAVTACLANRLTLVDAIDKAKQLVNMAIQYSDGQGRGTAPVNVLAFAAKKK